MPALRAYRRLVRPRLAQALVQTDMRVAWVLLCVCVWGGGDGAKADAELCALFNSSRFSGYHYMYHQVEHSNVLHSASTVHFVYVFFKWISD